MGRRVLDWLAVALLAGCMAMLLAMQSGIDRFLTGKNDFAAFYVGATLSGTPDLYDEAANQTLQRELLGALQPGVLYIRPPFYAFFLRPLAYLPYTTAYWLFQFLSIAAFVGSVWVLGGSSREFVIFAVVSVPALLQFMMGQDVTFVLLGVALSMAALRADRAFLAGVVLSLCAGKPHLVVLVPLVWAIQRKWRALVGGITGAAALVAIAFLSDGSSWVSRYLEMLGRPSIHPKTQLMPTVRGMLFSMFGAELGALTVLLCVATATLVAYIAYRQTVERAMAVAVLGGILISFHAYVQDCILALVLLAVIVTEAPSRPARILATAAVAPPLYFIGLFGTPWSALIPAVYLAMLVYCAFFWSKQADAIDPARRRAAPGASMPQTAFSKLTGGL